MLKEILKLSVKKKSIIFGFIVIMFFVIASIFAGSIAPYGPKDIVGRPFEAPSWEHLLGTNDMGIDVLTEIIYSGRISLTVGVVAGSAVVLIGCIVGLISGFFGGMVDEILMRITDVILIIPRVPLMIMLAAYIGPGMWTIIFVIMIVGWASIARQIRSQVLSVKEFTFVEAAKGIGASNYYIIRKHIIPNVMGVILANLVLEIMFAILAEAGMSFIGLGDPVHISWGMMLHYAQIRGAFILGAWWWLVAPGLCITLLTISFNFIGSSLNDHFILKLRKG
jgi:peptide/nickel transport system permease protein